MANRISSFLFIEFVIILCFAVLSLSNASKDVNPIILISDGLSLTQTSGFSIINDNLDDISHARFCRESIKAIYQFGDSLSDTG
ncbi:hypothetical protein KSS87_014930, partial [Heliosperma pusillum]